MGSDNARRPGNLASSRLSVSQGAAQKTAGEKIKIARPFFYFFRALFSALPVKHIRSAKQYEIDSDYISFVTRGGWTGIT